MEDSLENVEIFMTPDEATSPIVMPSRPPVTKAKKNWSLLRTAIRATRRKSSLTKHEEKLLRSICKPSIAKKDTTTNVGNDDDAKSSSSSSNSKTCASRAKLRKSIHAVSFALSKTERAFLQSLVDTPEISVEQVKKANEVLTNDPIYQPESNDTALHPKHKQNKYDDDTAVPSLRPKLRQSDASFRKELWTYNTTDNIISIESQSNYEETEPSKDERTNENGAPTKTRESVFYFIRQTLATLDGSFSSINQEEQDDKVSEKIQEAVEFKILGTHMDDPDCEPHVLSPPIMDALRPHFPFVIREDNFWLKYSMMRDGASMRSLLKQVKASTRTILAIETMNGDVFGSFTSSPWRAQGRQYYGSGESFLWRLKKSRYTPCSTVDDQIELESEVEIFKWSGENRNIQLLANPDDNLVLGGGGNEDDPYAIHIHDDDDRDNNHARGCGLMISADLMRGSSSRSLTFKNPTLPTVDEDIFEIANIEVWTMTPVDDEEEAALLEHGRMFVFDHGNFVQQ